MGNMPNNSLSGFHLIPKRKSGSPILNSAGTPPANMKMQISATAATEAHAVSMNSTCMTDSETFFIYSSERGGFI